MGGGLRVCANNSDMSLRSRQTIIMHIVPIACLAACLGLLIGAGPTWAAERQRPEVTIDPGGVPPAALRAISESVDTIARLSEDEDGGEETRLRRRAYDATLAALATQGYFMPVVTLTVGQDILGETWDIVIEPGQRAEVAHVDIQFRGRLAQPDYTDRAQLLRTRWTLPVGRPFINADWSSAKSALLNEVSEQDFYLAHLAYSQAIVDPDTAKVALIVEVDSGPRVRLGKRVIEGLQRTPEKLIDRYVRYTPGERYKREILETWEKELQATSFFRGAFVTLPRQVPLPAKEPAEKPAAVAPTEPPQAVDEVTLPVNVRVSEAQPKRIALGIGVDDSVGPRAETTYRQNVVLGQPLTLESGLGLDRKRQRVYLDFYLPPSNKGEKDNIGVLADRSDIQGLKVTRFALGATRLRERHAAGNSRVDYETRLGTLLASDQVRIDEGDNYHMSSLTGTAEWLRRDVNSKYDPREGNLIVAGAGLGVRLDGSKPFVRANLRMQQWWPIGARDVLTLRGELGKIWAAQATRVPDDFGFRTGGARSLRGYKYQQLGSLQGNAVVGAATLAVAGIEYMHYFNDTYGMAFFIDAGDAADSFKDMKMSLGYGIGARARTAAGPLFVDLAYGQRTRKLRLHLSLGIAF